MEAGDTKTKAKSAQLTWVVACAKFGNESNKLVHFVVKLEH